LAIHHILCLIKIVVWFCRLLLEFFGHGKAVDFETSGIFLKISIFEKTTERVAGGFDFVLDNFDFFGVILALEFFD